MPLEKIIARSKKNSENNEVSPHPPGLSIFRRDHVSNLEAFVYKPIVCLILQGAKVTSIGDQTAILKKGDALLVSHDLPVVSRITEASPDKPYLALILSLDLAIIRSLYDLVGEDLRPAETARALSTGLTDPVWLAPLERYLSLADTPRDARILGPATLREIHYRLLLSPIGGMLRNLIAIDSHASRIARAITRIRTEFASPLAVTDLARTAAMSASSFHAHFRTVTGTTPLQYIKNLRLIEARRLMSDPACSITEAAFAVGYESPTHFSRDYSRKFGCAPSRDMAKISAIS